MYNQTLHQQINKVIQKEQVDVAGEDNPFFVRFIANAASIDSLFKEIYGGHSMYNTAFEKLIELITAAYKNRNQELKERDMAKEDKGHWFLSNEITGMSLYVDRFCGSIANLEKRLDYFKSLGVNFLHLMPLFESPEGESDGGYAVSDFRKINKRFGTLGDLQSLQRKMQKADMYLMLDIVLNHTSQQHKWAQKAKEGDTRYEEYFYTYADRFLPDQYDASMPEIFPETAPGNFTFITGMNKWVMTVFHRYQWDLNYTNPLVFLDMLDVIFFYANLGVDILRIDAPAFIWKQIGTTCQNLPQAHSLLRLIKQYVQVAAPGMVLLGEAIVAPREIMKYFGTGLYTARECDFAYNATHMALQWDALATGDVRIMMAGQHEILQKPYGTTWINYTRCHDDIGLGYEDYMIKQAGYEPFQHRKFLQEYYAGTFPHSPAKGALFSVNPKTNDARISGSLASLCGLEKAIEKNDSIALEYAARRILLMQAHSFFLGGVPMIFYGDEVGYTNDYSYLDDPGKSYDNRWMHRPVIDWNKNNRISQAGTMENKIFQGTKRLIDIRCKINAVGDYKNLAWLTPYNMHIAGYLRTNEEQKLYCIFNFSDKETGLSWRVFKEHGPAPSRLYDHWMDKEHIVGNDNESLVIAPYQFYLFEQVDVF